MTGSTWNDPARVDEFARREPDHRLRSLLDRLGAPPERPVLDLGCAGGRNLRALAARGVPAVGLDASAPMLERARVEAGARVVRGRMDALPFPDDVFGWVVALGIYHCARSVAEWEAAVSESARVLVPGGLLLLSAFAPGTRLHRGPFREAPGEAPVHVDPDGRRAVLLDAAALDARLAALGLVPEAPTATVERSGEDFLRVVVNGLYRLGAGGQRW